METYIGFIPNQANDLKQPTVTNEQDGYDYNNVFSLSLNKLKIHSIDITKISSNISSTCQFP